MALQRGREASGRWAEDSGGVGGSGTNGVVRESRPRERGREGGTESLRGEEQSPILKCKAPSRRHLMQNAQGSSQKKREWLSGWAGEREEGIWGRKVIPDCGGAPPTLCNIKMHCIARNIQPMTVENGIIRSTRLTIPLIIAEHYIRGAHIDLRLSPHFLVPLRPLLHLHPRCCRIRRAHMS